MAKKTKQQDNPQYHKEQDYYDLKTDAVERLVNASEDTVDEVGAKEIKQYKSSSLEKLPAWVKAMFIKFWFNGAVCFFFFWGLGTYILNQTDLVIVVSVAMGVITDILVNNMLRFIDDGTNTMDKWMMFSVKKFWTFFANIIYAFVIITLVALTYNGINILFGANETGQITVGVEPLLFGIMYLFFDIIFIACKNLLLKIIADAKNKSDKEKSKNEEIED